MLSQKANCNNQITPASDPSTNGITMSLMKNQLGTSTISIARRMGNVLEGEEFCGMSSWFSTWSTEDVGSIISPGHSAPRNERFGCDGSTLSSKRTSFLAHFAGAVVAYCENRLLAQCSKSARDRQSSRIPLYPPGPSHMSVCPSRIPSTRQRAAAAIAPHRDGSPSTVRPHPPG